MHVIYADVGVGDFVTCIDSLRIENPAWSARFRIVFCVYGFPFDCFKLQICCYSMLHKPTLEYVYLPYMNLPTCLITCWICLNNINERADLRCRCWEITLITSQIGGVWFSFLSKASVSLLNYCFTSRGRLLLVIFSRYIHTEVSVTTTN